MTIRTWGATQTILAGTIANPHGELRRVDVPRAAIILGSSAIGLVVGAQLGGPAGAAVGALVGSVVGSIAVLAVASIRVTWHIDGRVEIELIYR